MYITIFALLVTYFIYTRETENPRRNDSEAFKDEHSNQACRRPTRHNPFMNPNYVTERDKNYESCRIYDSKDITEDESLKKEVEDAFNFNLYKDIDDPFNKQNSQRQFYTVPITSIPNDQEAFAKWLYTDNKVCKAGDQDACLRYEDLRYKASPVMIPYQNKNNDSMKI